MVGRGVSIVHQRSTFSPIFPVSTAYTSYVSKARHAMTPCCLLSNSVLFHREILKSNSHSFFFIYTLVGIFVTNILVSNSYHLNKWLIGNMILFYLHLHPPISFQFISLCFSLKYNVWLQVERVWLCIWLTIQNFSKICFLLPQKINKHDCCFAVCTWYASYSENTSLFPSIRPH